MTTNITDHVIDDVWDQLNEVTNQGTWPYTYDQVAHAVREALAGYTVIELPEPDDVMEGRAYWHSNAVDYEIATRVDYAGVAVVDDGPRVMNADYAEAHGLAVVAAARESRRLAREARRLASESSGGETP